MRPIAKYGAEWSACLYVCLSVGHIRVSHSKTAEPIEMPFAWVTGVGVIDRV